MEKLKIAVVAPSSPFAMEELGKAFDKATSLGIDVIKKTSARNNAPSFLNGSKVERLEELVLAESLDADGIWCVRGGCGAISLWHDYQKEVYESKRAPLMGYSDVSILHFMRFYRAQRIGIHGPGFLDLLKNYQSSIEALQILISKRADTITYPALRPVNRFIKPEITGELIVMNLTCLQLIIGGFEAAFFRGKILALEDVNEPHYRVYESLIHLKNLFALSGVKALLLGHFGKDRNAIIQETFKPVAEELAIPLFDWPIFGHELPNWPLLFGAKATIKKIDDSFYTLRYDEQHDHTPIDHEF